MADCRNAHRSRIYLKSSVLAIGEARLNGAIDRHTPFLFEGARPKRIILNDGRNLDRKTRLLQRVVDAQVIASEHTCATNRNVLYPRFWQNYALTRFSLSFDHTETSRVELEEMRYLILGFLRTSGDKAS